MKKLWQEFKKFIARGNVIDMAIGVIIASAFSAIVNSIVNNISVSCSHSGIHLSNSSGGTICGNSISESKIAGIYVIYCDGISCCGNSFSKNNLYGIDASVTDHSSFCGNYCCDNQNTNILFEAGSSNNIVVGNIATNVSGFTSSQKSLRVNNGCERNVFSCNNLDGKNYVDNSGKTNTFDNNIY